MGIRNPLHVPRMADRLALKVYRIRLAQVGQRLTPGEIARRYYGPVSYVQRTIAWCVLLIRSLRQGDGMSLIVTQAVGWTVVVIIGTVGGVAGAIAIVGGIEWVLVHLFGG